MEKVFIEDKQGNKVLPITHVSAVRDDNGNTIEGILSNYLSPKIEQSFTESEKLQARENIGAGAPSVIASASEIRALF